MQGESSPNGRTCQVCSVDAPPNGKRHFFCLLNTIIHTYKPSILYGWLTGYIIVTINGIPEYYGAMAPILENTCQMFETLWCDNHQSPSLYFVKAILKLQKA